MRLPAIVAVVLVWTLCTAARSQQDPGYLQQKKRMADLHVTGVVEPWLRAHHVPGAVVALVEGDRTLYRRGFGLADTGRGTAATPAKSIFRAGNLVRALTATAALQLVDSGALDLDADLTRIVGLKALEGDAFGPVTGEQLLLHTAGIDQRRLGSRARSVGDLTDLATYLELRMPVRVRRPGIVSIPSDHGYALLGRVLGEVSGQTFDAYLDQALLTPLGMTSTWVDANRLPADQLAIGYRRREEQLSAVTQDFARTVPASSLWTTAEDMANWMRMILSSGMFEGNEVLSPASSASLLEPQFSPHMDLPGRTLAFQEGQALPSGELLLESTSNGYSAVIALLPRSRLGLFVALNLEIEVTDLVRDILMPLDSESTVREESVAATGTFAAREWTGVWRDARVPLASAEKLASLVRQDSIRDAENGALRWRSGLFVPTTYPCFQERETLLRLCFVEGGDSTRFAMIGNLIMERISWYESRSVQMTLWVVFAALFLAAGWPRAPLPPRQPSLDPEDAFPPRWPITLARLAAALHFVFIALLAAVVALHSRMDSSILLYEVPSYLLAILGVPLLAAALTLISGTGIVSVWRNPRSTWGYRIYFAGLLAALVAFLPFLGSWKLLGFHL